MFNIVKRNVALGELLASDSASNENPNTLTQWPAARDAHKQSRPSVAFGALQLPAVGLHVPQVCNWGLFSLGHLYPRI